MQLTLLSTARLTDTAYDLRLLAPNVGFKAGQFVHMKCDGFTLRRPISVCDYDGEILRLFIDKRGAGTEWLVTRPKLTLLDVLAPLGNGFDAEGKRVLIVGGGIGVAPLLYAAKSAASADAIVGFRNAGAVMLLPDLTETCGVVQLCTDDGSAGAHAMVDRPLAARPIDSYDVILACGPTPMLRAVAAVCKERGAKLRVSLEERMACGIGACLGCAVEMADGSYGHVCSDGPVFDASEVAL